MDGRMDGRMDNYNLSIMILHIRLYLESDSYSQSLEVWRSNDVDSATL